MLGGYTGVKVFTATKANERAHLGDEINAWIAENSDCVIVDTVVRQSSDQKFHCLSVLIFYRR